VLVAGGEGGGGSRRVGTDSTILYGT